MHLIYRSHIPWIQWKREGAKFGQYDNDPECTPVWCLGLMLVHNHDLEEDINGRYHFMNDL